MSELMQQVNTLVRIGHIRTSPYHPQTDGLAERFNETLKTMIRRFAQEAPESGTSFYHTCFSLTRKFHKSPRVSLRLSFSTGDLGRARWIF